MSRGYSFNASHTLAYSLIALQEMNLCLDFPIIFWNCACLITDSGGTEDEEDEEMDDKKAKNNNYDKIAIAIGKMKNEGINIAPPDINKSSYSFTPDVNENKIYYGFRGLVNVGEDIINTIINNRPYKSIKEFYYKTQIKKQPMLTLIKSGAFDDLMDRKVAMGWYLWNTCKKKNDLNLRNFNELQQKYIPTEELIMEKKLFDFNRYLKDKCDDKINSYFILDERSLNFINNNLDILVIQQEDRFILDKKFWDKYYQKAMDVAREWIRAHKESLLEEMNFQSFKYEWDKYASGTISRWEMQSMCYYYHDHELKDVDKEKYGIVNFFSLPYEPTPIRYYRETIPLYSLVRICGTCIAKNKNKNMITLLTTEGVVNVSFRKDYFALFNRQISKKNPDGTKTIMEKSWFTRGNMLMITGMRRGDMFYSKKYSTTSGHQLYKIDEVNNKEITLRAERYQGDEEEEEED